MFNISGLVNGNWGSWSSYTTCNVTCGGGTIYRSRNCSNPPPTNGGLACKMDGAIGRLESQSKSCNMKGCPGMKHYIYILMI